MRTDESPSVLPGTLLDRYEILFELAHGGMGRVYIARRLAAHDVSRVVAIKRLDSRIADDETVQAFFREARIAAGIHHPNVVQTYELAEHDGSPFIVMQLVQGVSLGKLLSRFDERKEHLAPDVAAWIGSQAALGLHAAHELTGNDGSALEVVHRDISPQNILLSFDGRVYVVDFGIAKLSQGDYATGSGVIKGKFAYMSPEQAQALPLDRRSDIFSLGIVLHEALTGERLFAADSPAESLVKVINSSARPLADVREGISEGLNAIVLRCLEKVPGKRFATASELAQSLRDDLRRRGASIDEFDVAALLRAVFPGEQEALAERIRLAAAKPEVAQLRGESADLLSPTVTARGDATDAQRSATAVKSRAPAVATALIALAIASAAFVWSRSRPSAPQPEAPVSVLLTETSAPLLSPAPPATSQSATETAASAPAPSASPPPRASRPRQNPSADPPPAHNTAPAAPSGSYRGVPFIAL